MVLTVQRERRQGWFEKGKAKLQMMVEMTCSMPYLNFSFITYLFKIQSEGLLQPKGLHKKHNNSLICEEKKPILWFFEGVGPAIAQVALLLRCAPFPFGPGTRRRPGPTLAWGKVVKRRVRGKERMEKVR